MRPETLRNLLSQIADGQVSVETALARLRGFPYEDLAFAKLDHHRTLRCGFPEVVFGAGKSDEQVEQIFTRLAATGANTLATRVADSAAARILARFPAAERHELARCVTLRQIPKTPPDAGRFIAIVAAGTADLPIAEEARVTAEIMDQATQMIYDVGVAGLHRLLADSALLRQATALVVVAGMEGALPSVVGGLVAAPVLAVPTSVGYGASFGGLAALLAMLNSCAAGVSVVNIDNGFGAGYQAALICRAGAVWASEPDRRADQGARRG